MDVTFELRRSQGKPLYRLLADQFIAFIENGRLKTGDPLPPSRELAESLGVSRYTVTRSYDELVASGYIESRSTAGTFVTFNTRTPPTPQANDAPPPNGSLSTYAQRLTHFEQLQSNPEYLSALGFGAAPPNLLPTSIWRQLLLKHLHRDLHLVYQPDVFGRAELRDTLSRYLVRAKGLACTRDQIVIFSQSQNALNLLCRILFNKGDAIAVEEPGFGGIKNIATAQGLELQPVEVDAHGLNPAFLRTLPESVRAVYLTPAHHDPTGAVLSQPRRQEILNWARSKRSWIIEDDFDCYFNYGTRSLPLLASQDADSVIYLGSFWKLFYPVSTISFAVLPRSLCDVVKVAKTLAEPNSDAIEQLALSDYIREGRLERQVRRLRKIYALRRRTLIYHLKRVFGDTIAIDNRSAGSHQLIYLSLPMPDELVCELALEAGLGLTTTQNHYIGARKMKGEFLIDFSHLTPDQAPVAVERFASNFQ